MTDAMRSDLPSTPEVTHRSPTAPPERRIALVDLLDRVLAGGVVITGEVTLSVADVDMVRVSLRALISSVTALEPRLGPDNRQGGRDE